MRLVIRSFCYHVQCRPPVHAPPLQCSQHVESLWNAEATRISDVQLQHLRGMHQQGVHCAFHRDGYATRGTLILSSHHVREGACSGAWCMAEEYS